MSAEENASTSNRITSWIFFALLTILCILVLSLPLFPMQDDPMHLYLARILGDLIANPHGPYAQYYAIQHLLPPYSLHYYILIVLMKFLPAILAEKLVICIILICFCCGVRYLAMANGRSGHIFGLFSLAIALNWPLVMGFQNYILSLGIACFAIGVWIRSAQLSSHAMHALFIGLCALAAITHPLPLLLIIAFTAADLLLRALSSMLSATRVLAAGWWLDAVALAIASTLLLYLRAFTDKRRSAEDFHAEESVLTRAHYFIGLHGLDFFGRGGSPSRLLQIALYLIVLVSLGFAIAAFSKRQRGLWKPAYTWLLVTIIFTLALPFLPDDLSGSKALVSRLQVVTWIGFIAAASSFIRLSRRWTIALTLLAVVASLDAFALAEARLVPIGRRILAVDQHPFPAAGKAGILLSAGPDDSTTFAAVTYDSMLWQAVSYFRHTHAALLNTPWMDSTWLPLTAKPTMLNSSFTPWTMECYHCLTKQLIESASSRATVLPRIDFIVFVDQGGHATQAMLDQVLKADPTYRWTCQQNDWFILCRKLP